MTTSINPYPNIVPPADAEAMCDWADWDNEFRFVTNNHHVDGTNFVPVAVRRSTARRVDRHRRHCHDRPAPHGDLRDSSTARCTKPEGQPERRQEARPSTPRGS